MKELVVSLVMAVTAAAGVAPKHSTFHQQVTQEIKKVFGRHAPTALCETQAENRQQDPKAVSPWGDVGLFQINHRWHPQYSVRYLQTVRGNIQAAWSVSKHGTDWTPWTGTYGRGMCHGLG